MSAPEIAYRLACAPVAAVGGATAQHVALLVAMRWAQPDGRFILRQVAIQAAAGLSERPISAAVRDLRTAKVFVPLGADEWLIAVDHLPRIGGTSLRIGGGILPASSATGAAATSESEAGAAGRRREARGGRSRPDTAPPSESEAATAGKEDRTAPRPQAVSPLLDVSVSSSPSNSNSNLGEGEDARAGEAPAAAEGYAAAPADAGEPFSDLDERRLRWLAARGVLMVNPATGEDLRREWLRITAGVGAELVKAILDVRAGDYPSDFRKASEPFATQVDDARRAAATRAAAAAAAIAADQARQVQDAEEARQRGPFLEQGAALIAEIVAADPRRLRLAEAQAGWFRAVADLREAVRVGRVQAIDLAAARDLWGKVRTAELPAEPPPPAPRPAEPPLQRSFTEPASADSEPAAP